jgi:thiamine monophosphate kinase
MAETARQLRARGVALAGVIQHGGSECSMALELLPSGTRMPISQNLGNGALACKLDTAAMAEAASIVRKAIDGSPALAIFNKFGSQEAAGAGLRDEMIAARAAGIPVLTAVKENLVEQWAAFTGSDHALLACTPEAALAWWDGLAVRD